MILAPGRALRYIFSSLRFEKDAAAIPGASHPPKGHRQRSVVSRRGP